MSLRLHDYVRVYDNALPSGVCDDMVQAFAMPTSPSQRRLGDTLSFDEFVIDGRPDWTEYQLALEGAKDEYFKRYRNDCPGRFPSRWDHEAFRLKRYRPDRNDRFEEHVDAYDLTSSKRFLVCFWYLNDVADGGETHFPLLRLTVRPRVGRLVMFPPYWMYEHAGRAPRSGPKHIVSTYLLFAA